MKERGNLIENYRGLYPLLHGIEPEHSKDLTRALIAESWKDREDAEEVNPESPMHLFLDSLFAGHGSYERARYRFGKIPQPEQVVLSDAGKAVLAELVKEPRKYAFQLAAVLGTVATDSFGVIKESLQPRNIPGDTGIFIDTDSNSCNQTEWSMSKAFDTGTAILVNNTFLVRPEGRHTGLCVTHGVTRENRLVIESVLYRPEEDQHGTISHTIKAAAAEGKKRLELPKSRWGLIRAVGEDDIAGNPKQQDRIMNEAKSYIASLPERL